MNNIKSPLENSANCKLVKTIKVSEIINKYKEK